MKESDIRPTGLLYQYLRLSVADADRLVADRSTPRERPCPGCGGVEHRVAFEKNGFRKFFFPPVDLDLWHDRLLVDGFAHAKNL